MRQIKCPDCNEKCIKRGVLNSGSQRWFCKHCKVAFTIKINNLSKELNLFLNWLFSTIFKLICLVKVVHSGIKPLNFAPYGHCHQKWKRYMMWYILMEFTYLGIYVC